MTGKFKMMWKKLTQNVSKKELTLIILLSVAFVFNLFVFNQFDVLLHNQNEFGVTGSEIVWAFIWRCTLITLSIFVVLYLLCNFCKIGYKIIISLLFGFMVATYLQVLIFNGNYMNIMDGSKVFNISLFLLILNCILFAIIIGLPVALMFIFKKKQVIFQKLMLTVSIIVIGMQFVGLMVTAINTPEFNRENKYFYFSYDEYANVSQEENIIVFLMDRLGTHNSLGVFNKWPESKNIFDGFTMYQNNLSEFSQTFPSVAQTLTGVSFTETESQSTFLPYAWDNSIVFKELKNKGWTVNGLLDSYSNFYNIEDVSPYFDNIKEADESTIKIVNSIVFEKMTQISFLRNLPFAFKNNIGVDYSNLSNEFVDLSGNLDYFPKSASPKTDLFYYDALRNKNLTASTSSKTFNFVHLNSSHTPIQFDKNLNNLIDFSINGVYEQTYGSLNILNEYLNQLKSLKDINNVSLFDKSTIIVLGDHADGATNPNLENINQNAFASLFLKPKNVSSNNKLIMDTITEMSNSNFAPTILELIGAEDKKAGKQSYFDVITNPDVQERSYYITGWTGFNGDFQSMTEYIGKYSIKGNAYNAQSWKWIG